MIPARALEAVTPQELSSAASLFGSVKQLRLRLTNADELTLDRNFESHVQTVLEKLENRLSVLEKSRLYKAEVAMARHGLFDASFQQAIVLCQSISPALGECLKDLRSAHSRILVDVQQTLADSINDTLIVEREIKAVEDKLAQSDTDCHNLGQLLEELNKESEDYKTTIIGLREQLRTCKVDLAKANDDIASIPYSAVKSSHVKPVAVPKFDTSVDSKKSKKKAEIDGETVTSMNSSKIVVTRIANPEGWLANFRTELQKAIDEKRSRELSLKCLREFLDRIYESKFSATNRLAQGTGNTPIETMEMHLYGYLEKKYGLRSIAAEQAGAVLLAVDKYATEDSFVNVFHKTFRNEVEEDFWLVQQELMKSIRDLMLVQIMSRYPTKDQATLVTLLDQKINDGWVTEDEWNDMINYLYNNTDSTAICAMLKRLARDEMQSLGLLPEEHVTSLSPLRADEWTAANKRSHQISSSPIGGTAITSSKQSLNLKSEMSRKIGYSSPSLKKTLATVSMRDVPKSPKLQLRVSFAVFQSCVLDFQLKSRMQYLASFRAAFEKVDTDFDGIISSEQFQDCYKALKTRSGLLPESVVESSDDETVVSLLQVMDPFQSNRITFSIVASTLSKIAVNSR